MNKSVLGVPVVLVVFVVVLLAGVFAINLYFFNSYVKTLKAEVTPVVVSVTPVASPSATPTIVVPTKATPTFFKKLPATAVPTVGK